MIYLLIWLFLGSLSLNLMYVKRTREKRVPLTLNTNVESFIYKIIIGWLALLIGVPILFIISALLINSMVLNILHIINHKKRRTSPTASYADYFRGFLFGIVLGPLGLPVMNLLDKYLPKDEGKKEAQKPENYRGP